MCFLAWLKNLGFREWHKGKETPRTDPENTGSKKQRKAVFFVFHERFAWIFSKEDELSRKSKVWDGFSWESNWGCKKNNNNNNIIRLVPARIESGRGK